MKQSTSSYGPANILGRKISIAISQTLNFMNQFVKRPTLCISCLAACSGQPSTVKANSDSEAEQLYRKHWRHSAWLESSKVSEFRGQRNMLESL